MGGIQSPHPSACKTLGATVPRSAIFAFFLAVLAPAAAAASGELGHPVVQMNPPGQARIDFFSIAVTQDANGCVYLGGLSGIRYYEGLTWEPIKVPTESAGIRKFALTAGGTVYVAGAGVVGFLRGSGPDAVFVSLADRLPPSELGCDELHDVLAVGETVYFTDEEKILIWRNGQFTAIPYHAPPRSRGARLHRDGEAVYVTALGRGLGRVEGDRVKPVADDPVFRENQIILFERAPSGEFTLLTAKRGFFRFAGGRVTSQAFEADRRFADKTIHCALRLPDGELAVAFDAPSGDGGARFDAAGRYVGPIDTTIGFYVNTLRAFFRDREGGLWVGTESGAFRLEWPSAISVFNVINGLGSGAVSDIARHDGVFYAATGEGVYRMIPANDETGRGAVFERIFNRPAYAVLSHPAGLLAMGYDHVFLRTPAGFVPVAETPAGGGRLLPSRSDPTRVWLSTARGFSLLRLTAQGWEEKPVEAIPPADVVAATSGPWRADATGIWQVPQNGSAPRRLPMLVSELAGAVAQLREEPGQDGAGPVLWICGADGLIRIDVARAFPAPVPFATQLWSTGVKSGDQLAPNHPELKFTFVGQRHQLRKTVTYQARLEGLEADWSDWSAKRERTYAHLPPGRYRFEVRSRDLDGQLGAPATLAFAVLPPWWRTWWMLLGYAMVAAGSVAGIVSLRTRALLRRAEHLEALVAERTDELAKKNTELVRLNQLELDEKISARLGEEKARLEVLRYQLNPHFLFNTLASISAALPAGASAPRTMVERLAEFCRLTLHRPNDRDWTTVGEEVQLLRSYLEIEQSRWGALLDVEIDSDPALAGEQLPHFLLLPLVENALKYGRATSPDRVGLRLTAARAADGALVFTVANTGEWIEPATKRTVSTLGIGLENLRERLARHYPRTHHLDFSHANGWVTVILRIFSPPRASAPL